MLRCNIYVALQRSLALKGFRSVSALLPSSWAFPPYQLRPRIRPRPFFCSLRPLLGGLGDSEVAGVERRQAFPQLDHILAQRFEPAGAGDPALIQI